MECLDLLKQTFCLFLLLMKLSIYDIRISTYHVLHTKQIGYSSAKTCNEKSQEETRPNRK